MVGPFVARGAGCLGLQLFKLLFQQAVALQHRRQLVDQVVTAALDQARRFLELFFSRVEVGQRRSASDRLDTPHILALQNAPKLLLHRLNSLQHLLRVRPRPRNRRVMSLLREPLLLLSRSDRNRL